MKIRIVVQSTENGEQEFVRFSEDLDVPVSDLLIHNPSCSIDIDKVIDIEDFPGGFPTDRTLQRL